MSDATPLVDPPEDDDSAAPAQGSKLGARYYWLDPQHVADGGESR